MLRILQSTQVKDILGRHLGEMGPQDSLTQCSHPQHVWPHSFQFSISGCSPRIKLENL